MGCNAWNHPPGCNCGWGGENYGSYPTTPLPTADDWKRDTARNKLERLNVRSYSTCYVVPNAACPVCGQSVYFYANEHGSRVYFNELGPPWPKHGCTDRRQVAQTKPPATRAPVRRSKSDVRDILETARAADLSFGYRKSKKRKPKWILHLVLEIRRTNSRITIVAESISGEQNSKVEFSVLPKLPVIEVGDFVSKKGDAYSFLRRDTLETIEVFDGHSLDTEDEEASQTVDASVIPTSPAEMTQGEFKHFHSPQMHVKILTAKYSEVLSSLSKRNIIGPKLVTHYLNAAGHRTAVGSEWTPRLSYFLICLVDAPLDRVPGTKTQKTLGRRKEHLRGEEKSPYPNSRQRTLDEPMGIDDLMRKLSRIGRVTRQGD